MLFNYTISNDEGYKRNSIKDFAYTSEKVRDICVAAGFVVEDVVDRQSDLNEKSRAYHNRMVELRVLEGAVDEKR
ncbi:hypothetical protein N9W44_02610 [Alphaproteobacteria bacterium]|nr:hypothetical protein [Alphaproteobacteria bacterium]